MALWFHLLATAGAKISHSSKKAEKSPSPSAGDCSRWLEGSGGRKKQQEGGWAAVCGTKHQVPQHPSSPAFLHTQSQIKGVGGVMADAAPLPETSAACRKVGKPWESGFALMTGADVRRIGAGKAKGHTGNGRCLWQMIVPDDCASRIQPVYCLQDFKCSAQNNLLRFTVSSSQAIYSLW